MLNFLSVLQRLSVKIKLDKVNPYYPNHPRCCLKVKDDSRLHATSNVVTEWIDELSMYSIFLTLLTFCPV